MVCHGTYNTPQHFIQLTFIISLLLLPFICSDDTKLLSVGILFYHFLSVELTVYSSSLYFIFYLSSQSLNALI